MKRLLILIAVGLVVSAPAVAQVPRTMSYQGVLTDGAGNLLPDGLYDITFRIYDVPSGGSALYTEAHTGANQVQLTKGAFSVVLGSLTPISLPFDDQYYLGIQVAADPELVPRVQLASSPYALGLILPFACSTTGGSTLLQGLNYGDTFGGAIHTYSPTGQQLVRIEPDVNGGGAGWFQVTRNGTPSVNGFVAEGNTGTGEPATFLVGSARSVTMDMAAAGDAAVQLPGDALSAPEILDEPGIAQGHANGQVNIPTGVFTDLVTVTITTPLGAAGYIVVEADGQHGIGGNGTDRNYAALQIDETAGGAIDGNHYFYSGYNPTSPNHFTWAPVSVRRTYFKAAGGAYTFRLEGMATNPASLLNYLWNPTITASFYPTSYGAVTTAPALAEAAQFERIEQTSSAGAPQPGGEGMLVDLRELELKLAKARETAAIAQRNLLEARFQAQLNGGAPRAGAKRP